MMNTTTITMKKLVLFLLFASTLTVVSAADEQRTTLQGHVDFFDRDGDGFITQAETRESLAAIGFPGGPLAVWAAAAAIHAGLPKTHGGGDWKNWNVIDTSIISKGIHGSDSGTYDANGGVVEAKFNAIFDYDADGNGAIDTKELEAFHEGRKASDGDGDSASRAEFTALMLVAGEKNEETGLNQLSRDVLLGVYDGSLFYQLEEKRTARHKSKLLSSVGIPIIV